MIKKLVCGVVLGVVVLAAVGGWMSGLLEPQNERVTWRDARPQDLPYLAALAENIPPQGKVLAVVTSTNTLGDSGRYTGYEHTELARAYYVFQANGFDVDIASPMGGEPPAVFDNDDMGPYDYAFLNDPVAMAKLKTSQLLSEVNKEQYQAVYFVGGKGAMFDFPDNGDVQALVEYFYSENKTIGAVCHGPAALVRAKDKAGRPLLQGKRVSGFSNAEELLLMSDAEKIFPFLLQSELESLGAEFSEAPKYLKHVVQDENILTGQNPWSVWALSEAMVRRMGRTPIARPVTAEELSVKVLATYESLGNSMAVSLVDELAEQGQALPDRNLILMHGVVAVMELKIGKAIDLVSLAYQIKQAAGRAAI